MTTTAPATDVPSRGSQQTLQEQVVIRRRRVAAPLPPPLLAVAPSHGDAGACVADSRGGAGARQGTQDKGAGAVELPAQLAGGVGRVDLALDLAVAAEVAGPLLLGAIPAAGGRSARIHGQRICSSGVDHGGRRGYVCGHGHGCLGDYLGQLDAKAEYL